MILDVSPNRMQLLKLKKKRQLAVRGHKLMKDKLEELIRKLLEIVHETTALRQKVDEKYSIAQSLLLFSGFATFPESVDAALMSGTEKLQLKVDYESLLSMQVPVLSRNERTGSFTAYGYGQTSVALDMALEAFEEVMDLLVSMAELEKKLELLAHEIVKTRRRVNALEYILIPNIGDTIKYISMKLDETERTGKTQLMRIKDIVRSM